MKFSDYKRKTKELEVLRDELRKDENNTELKEKVYSLWNELKIASKQGVPIEISYKKGSQEDVNDINKGYNCDRKNVAGMHYHKGSLRSFSPETILVEYTNDTPDEVKFGALRHELSHTLLKHSPSGANDEYNFCVKEFEASWKAAQFSNMGNFEIKHLKELRNSAIEYLGKEKAQEAEDEAKSNLGM